MAARGWKTAGQGRLGGLFLVVKCWELHRGGDCISNVINTTEWGCHGPGEEATDHHRYKAKSESALAAD